MVYISLFAFGFCFHLIFHCVCFRFLCSPYISLCLLSVSVFTLYFIVFAFGFCVLPYISLCLLLVSVFYLIFHCVCFWFLCSALYFIVFVSFGFCVHLTFHRLL